MSSLAYDSNNNPMFGGVNYQWSLSSSDTVATLDKTDKDISQLTALKSGCGELTVTGISNGNTITKALRVVVYEVLVLQYALTIRFFGIRKMYLCMLMSLT
jgi:hypothetical protein